MAIFDQYQFEQGSYGGGGSLIDRLLSQLQTQGQYQPSQGYGSNPMDANAQMQPQAQPIAIGDYQMPRIGDAAQFTPEPPASWSPAEKERFQSLPRETQEFLHARNAPQPPQPQASSLPEFMQPSGPGNNLLAGLQSFGGNLHNGLIGALISGASGLATGRSNDPKSLQQQAMQAQYKALIPILGEQKAALAVLNPTMGNELLKQATTSGAGTVINNRLVDPRSGSVIADFSDTKAPETKEFETAGGKVAMQWDPASRSWQKVAGVESGALPDTVTGPDGRQIPIPAGVDRKEFIKKVTDANAKAATGEKTEVQAKSEKFGNQMELAERNLKGLEGEGQSYAGRALEGAPFIGNTMATNWAQSNSYLKYKQARDRFISAMLRDESGAAIGTPEFERLERELFPQPGEGADIVRQKAEARKVAVEAMKKSAGPGYKSPTFGDAGGGAKSDPLGIR